MRDHVREALDAQRGPVGAASMQDVLDAMGNPLDWLPVDMRGRVGGMTIAGAAPRLIGREDWRLAYVSLALLLLAFALPPFLWIGVFGAFLAARASMCAARGDWTHADQPSADREAQAWIRNPSLLALYVPMVMGILLLPAITLRFAADFVVDHPELFLRFPIEIEFLADRIAQFRLSSFDPATTLANAVRSGHYLVFPVGVWLLVLAVLVALAPRSVGRIFRPFLGRRVRGVAGTLALCGFILVAAALGLAMLKQSIVHSALI